LLLISRIENNQYQLNEQINFKLLLSDLIESLEDRIEEKGIQIHLNIRHSKPFLGNSTLIHILFYNLVVNALKYNQNNGSIIIWDKTEKEAYTIYIQDTGIGMTADEIKHVFDRFQELIQNKKAMD